MSVPRQAAWQTGERNVRDGYLPRKIRARCARAREVLQSGYNPYTSIHHAGPRQTNHVGPSRVFPRASELACPPPGSLAAGQGGIAKLLTSTSAANSRKTLCLITRYRAVRNRYEPSFWDWQLPPDYPKALVVYSHRKSAGNLRPTSLVGAARLPRHRRRGARSHVSNYFILSQSAVTATEFLDFYTDDKTLSSRELRAA